MFTHVWCFSSETCSVHFDNPDDFRRFRVTIKPGLSGYPSIFPVHLRISSVYSLYISGYPQYIPCTSQDTPVYSSILTVHISESICQGISIFCATDEGYWKGGTFSFKVTVPEEYNIKVSHVYPVILCCHDQSHKSFLQPPHVVCRTRLWHPNINETGEVCLRYAHHRTRSCSKSPEAFWFSLPFSPPLPQYSQRNLY